VELKTRPNEGMLLSLRNAALAFLTVGVPVGLVTGVLLVFLPGASDHSAALAFRGTTAQMKVANERAAHWVENVPTPGSAGDSVRRALIGSESLPATEDTARFARVRAYAVGLAVRDLLRSVEKNPGLHSDPAQLSAEKAAVLRQLQAAGVFGDTSSVIARGESQTTRVPFNVAVIFGLTLGTAAGGIGFLLLGGMGVFRHYVLRLVIAVRRLAPLDYARFLDVAATQLGFLQKVGGGYVFMHRYLLEHFANMSVEAGVLEAENIKDADGLWLKAPIIAASSLKNIGEMDLAIRTADQSSLTRLEIAGAIWVQQPARFRISEYGDGSSEIICESPWCRGRRGFVPNDRMRIVRWMFRPNPVAPDEECAAANRPRDDVRCPHCAWHPWPVHRWSCRKCAMEWDTFTTGAVCPRCATADPTTQCQSCKQNSPIADWYVNGAVARTLTPADFTDSVA